MPDFASIEEYKAHKKEKHEEMLRKHEDGTLYGWGEVLDYIGIP